MKYGLNDRPGFWPLMMYGLQWWVVSIPCVIILGIVVAKLHFTGIEAQTFYMQKMFGVMGIAMLVQVLWGHRLPLIIGPASGVLIGVLVALLLSFAPGEAIDAIPAMIRPVVGNGFVMGVITVLILEHLVFKKRRARK